MGGVCGGRLWGEYVAELVGEIAGEKRICRERSHSNLVVISLKKSTPIDDSLIDAELVFIRGYKEGTRRSAYCR